ncbi:TlpA family protein disulfide reductase [Brevibacillus sp. SAFN-007a]|uniref:TlpA family protein disulfide reductase n=1 Tax=Brevibacillus sp. SAFN-007a TaxID=3436862 RepID=UPI003F7F26B2
MKKSIAILFIIMLAVIAIYNNNQTKNGSPDQIPKIGFTAPHFSLSSLDNQTYQVAGKRDKPVILNFWASWCGPCREEVPYLKELYEKYKDRLDFYAINLTANDDVESAKAFVKEFGLSFPILLDETGKIANLYQVISIPTTYFINTNGIITQKIIGATDPGSFEQYMKELVR